MALQDHTIPVPSSFNSPFKLHRGTHTPHWNPRSGLGLRTSHLSAVTHHTSPAAELREADLHSKSKPSTSVCSSTGTRRAQVKENCISLIKEKLHYNRFALGLRTEGNRVITVIVHKLSIHRKVVQEDAVSLPHKSLWGAYMSLSRGT